MNKMKTTLAKFALWVGLFATFPLQATPLALSDDPLFVAVSVAPNIVLTLDDSGSMSRAFTPDLCGNPDAICDNNPDSRLDHRYVKSSHYNPIYYNPSFVYPSPVDGSGTPLSTGFTTAYVNGFASTTSVSGATSFNLSSNYRPSAGLYLKSSSKYHEFMRHYASDVRCKVGAPDNDRCQYRQANGTWVTSGSTDCDSDNDNNASEDDGYCRLQGMPAYYYVFDSSNGSCNNTATDNDCYDLVVVSSTSGPGTADLNNDGVVNAADQDERQNFANWYSFYRTRNLSTISATALAFNEFSSSVRLAWQALNTCRGSDSSLVTSDCEGWATTSPNYSNAIKTFTGTHRTNFYNWLLRFPTGSSTPLRTALRRAGEYYKTTGENSPYDNDFTTASSGQLTCRRDFHILMTDGIWNDSPTAVGNADNTSRTLPDGVSYSPAAPFNDGTSNTLADYAFEYWRSDLTGLTNNLVPRYNDRSGTATAQYRNPKNDPASWQHMVNYTVGLGLEPFLNAAGLTWGGDTFNGSYLDIAAGTTPWPSTTSDGGKVADLWHAAVNSRGRFFSASDPAALTSAFRSIVSDISSQSGAAAALSTNSTTIQSGSLIFQAKFDSSNWTGALLAFPISDTGTVGATVWDASTLMPSHGSRNILTYYGGDGRTLNSCTATVETHLGGAAECPNRLAWFRGDPDQELRNAGAYRNRSITVLGDIINSDPAYTFDEDLGFGGSALPEASSYPSFVTGKAARVPMVYVGANDGMLHAFQADQGGGSSGRELFAYVPEAVLPNLNLLMDPSYTHQYYVDGAPTVGDAYFGSAWHTVLVGGLNSGGKSVYALDVTNPTSFNENNVLWEFTDANDLGNTYSQPLIARLNNGVWAAIFGNGYNSANEDVYLYVVNLQTGALIKKIQAGGATSGNGLSTPVVLDTDGNKTIDYVYAGDLRGNLWKFDLSSTSDADWGVANSGDELFQARNAANNEQAITAAPIVISHPNSGYMVLFGTGMYLRLDDVDSANFKAESFYGIWDNGTPITEIDRSTLQQQSIDFQQDYSDFQVRSTTANAVDWGTQRGWYLDLLDPPSPGTVLGERVVSKAAILAGRVIFVTLVPATDPCIPGGSSWLMELDAISGALTESVFDFNNDDEFDSEDLVGGRVVVGIRRANLGISKTPVVLNTANPNVAFKFQTGTTGLIQSTKNKGGGSPPATTGEVERVYWMEIR